MAPPLPSKHRRVHTTPQTLMLGAGDDFDPIDDSDGAVSKPSQPLTRWFSNKSTSRTRPHDEDDNSIIQDSSQTPANPALSRRQQHQQHQHDPCMYEQLDENHGHLSVKQQSSLSFLETLRAPSTVIAAPLSDEERLQQDCSFFYRDMDGQQQQQQQPRISNFRTLLTDSFRTSLLPYQYRDVVVPVLSPPVLSHYRSKYQQLNQELPRQPRKKKKQSWFQKEQADRNGHVLDSHQQHDLHLSSEADSEAATAAALSSVNSNNNNYTNSHHHLSVQYSSLLYQHKGRILLRLPQDHVQLIMDPDLEVGRLSVKQWRTEVDDKNQQEDDDSSTIMRTMTMMDHLVSEPEEAALLSALPSTRQQSSSSVPAGQKRPPRPPLYYVLTVPDDLYRQVVNDMSNAVMQPFCNVGRCCNDDQHVNIGVAVLIMATVMMLLLIIGAVYGDS